MGDRTLLSADPFVRCASFWSQTMDLSPSSISMHGRLLVDIESLLSLRKLLRIKGMATCGYV